MSASTWSLSITDRERLIKAAFEAKEFAYSRYSKFRVGAALLSTDGQIIKGANIENASYGGTICAERTAFVKAVSEGTRSFSALAVVTDVASPLSPCGMCRQVIREFCAQDMPILLVPSDYDSRIAKGEKDGILETSIAELLPHSFGPEELELPREPSA
ncbi:Cytidine deaminase [Abortiporus biennis]